MICTAALSTTVTTGLMISGCVASSEKELWTMAPIIIGLAVFAAWSMVIAPNLNIVGEGRTGRVTKGGSGEGENGERERGGGRGQSKST
jgi:hypothetical protein